jgi:MFS family permease
MRGLGMAIAGGVLGIIIDNVGWRLSYILPGSMIVLSCIVVLFFPETKISDEEKIVVTTWNDYKETFTKKSTWWVTLFMILSGTGITVVAVFTTFLNSETSFSIEGIGWGVTAFALGQFFGAAIIGLSSDFLPMFPVLLGTTVVYGGMIGTMFLISGGSTVSIFVIIAAVGAINGGYEATQMRIGMEHSVGPIAGTSYNWFMSISNLGQLTLGTYLIADIAERIGFSLGMQIATVFLVLALIPGWISIKLIKKRQKIEEKR